MSDRTETGHHCIPAPAYDAARQAVADWLVASDLTEPPVPGCWSGDFVRKVADEIVPAICQQERERMARLVEADRMIRVSDHPYEVGYNEAIDEATRAIRAIGSEADDG